ncbi:MAG: UDP-glucose/GDP-mannose dehydrogenase family protein [Patescibacteria group bacterium]|jgi:UDPglucose 6-dehydrogenase
MKKKKVRRPQQQSFDLAVIGAGYVGLASAACFAEIGKRVLLIDRKKNRVERLKRGIMPFFEPGLVHMVNRNVKSRRLVFTHSIADASKKTEMLVIAVGTPTLPNGSVDMRDYWNVIEDIVKHMKGYKIVVDKSTVPIGTARKAYKHISRYHGDHTDVVSFPEFLREGSAIRDFMKPDRLVIGTDSKRAEKRMRELLRPIRTKKVFCGLETAEMVKYASNAFLATKISFINEIANIAETVGANVDEVAYGMGLDKRIGKSFLKAGIGYGGSCFPKDVKALKHIAGSHRYSFKLLRAVIQVNADQRKLVILKLQEQLGKLKGKTIAMLGLAFKNNTDDVRESASIDIIRQLLKQGAKVAAFDPLAESNARKVLTQEGDLVYCDTPEQALIDADAVVIATEWDEFKRIDWKSAKEIMRKPIVVDGRNMLNPVRMKELGFTYIGIGK